jgi:AcrR family transcriptional regulator
MPPIADKHLEDRILKAGQRLWRTRGERGFTLREIARAAGTTTPTIYQRFHNKEALLKALGLRIRDTLNAELFSASSLEESCRRYLQYAETNPREYMLMNVWWPNAAPDLPRPGRAWLLSQLATRFGGQPEEYDQVFYTLLFLLHGAASMLTATEPNSVVHDEIRDNCIRVCEKLIENVGIFRARAERHDFNGS